MTKESALFAHHKPMHIARRVSNKRDNLAHRYFIVSELYRTVTERPVFTPDELAAFRWQDEQRRLRLGHIFAGKEIVWRADLLRFSLPDRIWKAVTRNTLFSHPAGAARR